MTFILAGSFREYEDFLRDHPTLNPTENPYLRDEHQLLAQKGVSVRPVGKYWRNPLYDTPVLNQYKDQK